MGKKPRAERSSDPKGGETEIEAGESAKVKKV